ncbi:MAG: hypothetical protein AB7S71_10200 [Dongiaceae bacterium]
MTSRFEQLIDIYPAVWPDKALQVQPGDLRLFAPAGKLDTGLPKGETAHDTLIHRPADPFRTAPMATPAGGTIYLRGDLSIDDLAGLIRLLQVDAAATDYAAFIDRAVDPLGQRYVTQLRLVRAPALAGIYCALSLEEMRRFPAQRLAIGALVAAFITLEQQNWDSGASSDLFDRQGTVRGRMAERLGFGFTIENPHYGVYRAWSRLWLDPQ